MPMPGSLFSPATEGFQSPPVTPGFPPPKDAPSLLKPSLSRKNSRPSNLSISRNGSADWNPDIVLEETSPDPRSAQPQQRTPETARAGLLSVRDATVPADQAAQASGTHRGPKGDHYQDLKSPCFVHSNLDKGASLADWLKEKRLEERRANGMSHHGEDVISLAQGLSPHSVAHKLPNGDHHHSNHSSDAYSSPDDDYSDDEYGASLTKQLAETAVGVREMSKQLGRARIHSNIQSVLIVTKAKDNRLIQLTRELALYLMRKRRKGQERGLVVYVDNQLRTSRRFDAAGIEREHPELFAPVARRRSSSSTSLASMTSHHNGGEHHIKEEGQLRYWTSDMCSRSPHLFDFVVTLGGDGTVLFTSWLFQRIVPPVLPFALGSLGFLTNFDFADHETVMDSVIDTGIRVNLRMRFTCTVFRAVHVTRENDRKVRAVKKAQTGEIMMKDIERGGWEALEAGFVPEGASGSRDKEIMCFTTRPVESFEVLNDLVVDRGPSPYVSQLELFADEHHLTTVQADGLCIATPTGSTAYSMSAGGSLVHPEIPSILVTPLCPHTLSFRPMLLPDSMELRICVPFNSRSTAWVSFDGRGRVELKQGDHIKVTASKYPFPTVCADRSSTDWFHSISRTLKWNERERQKSFVVVEESPKARRQMSTREEKQSSPGIGEEEEEEEEEEDKFDIDDLSSAEEEAKSSITKSMLNESEKRLGREKVHDPALQDEAAALSAARAIVAGSPFMHGGHVHASGLHSGIETPDRFMAPVPHPPPTSARHVMFTQASLAAPSSAAGGEYHAPRALYPGEHRRPGPAGEATSETERGENVKTPTVAEIRRGGAPHHHHAHPHTPHTPHSAHRSHSRSRSRSKDFVQEASAHHRAFAVWGQDESESEVESSASDSEILE